MTDIVFPIAYDPGETPRGQNVELTQQWQEYNRYIERDRLLVKGRAGSAAKRGFDPSLAQTFAEINYLLLSPSPLALIINVKDTKFFPGHHPLRFRISHNLAYLRNT